MINDKIDEHADATLLGAMRESTKSPSDPNAGFTA
jgi:hypothetical protein